LSGVANRGPYGEKKTVREKPYFRQSQKKQGDGGHYARTGGARRENTDDFEKKIREEIVATPGEENGNISSA